MRKLISLFLILYSLFLSASPIETQTGTWWHWMNGHITKEGITKDLEAMKANGITNATVLNCYRPFGSQFKAFEKYVAPENMREIDESHWPVVKFGTKEWYDMFRWALDEAERLGMEIGTANCDGWSETGGPWITAENSMKAFTFSKYEVTGAKEFQSTTNGNIEIDLPKPQCKAKFYRDVCVLAYAKSKEQRVVDITKYLKDDGTLILPSNFQFSILNSKVKAFTILRFGYTTSGQKNHPASPEGVGFECDKMDTTALDLHFAHFPTEVMKAAGRHKGKTFSYFLVDSWECRLQTWTKALPQEFEKRRGYSMLPYLPVLAGDSIYDKTTCEAFVHDYKLTLGELIEEYFFKHLAKLCHSNGMKLYSEGIYGGKDDLPACDIMATYKYCDVPMTEFWCRLQAQECGEHGTAKWPFTTKISEPFNHILPQHSALIYNKPILASEAYTGAAIYSDAPWDMQLCANQAYAEGVNKMMLHSYVHQMQERGPGFTLGIYGQSFNRLNWWFNESLSYWTWQERIQKEMQDAPRCADVLLYIGDKRPACECKSQELDKLIPRGMKYQYVNSEGLSLLKMENYKGIVIRDTAINLSTMQKLYEMYKAGYKIYGVKPTSSLRLLNHEKESAEVKRMADEIWGDTEFRKIGDEEVWDVVFSDKEAYKHTDYLHRKAGTEDRYFIANMQDAQGETLHVSFSGIKAKEGLLIDPIDGKQYSLENENPSTGSGQAKNENSLTSPCYTIKLQPKQAVIVVFGRQIPSDALSYADEVLNPHILDTLTFAGAKGTMTFLSDKDIKPQEIGSFHTITESKDSNIRYYSGYIDYDFSLDIPTKYAGKKLYLNIPAFGATAHVWVNGQDQGIIWNPYYALKIDNGNSTNLQGWAFKIRVTNPWRNRLVGDLNQDRGDKAAFTTSPGIEKYGVTPFVRKDADLIPAGISQPIKIIVKE